MLTSTICIDASVVVRMVLNRHDQPAWQTWEEWQRAQARIVAPELLLYEVTNALYQQQRQGKISAEITSLLLGAALALPIVLVTDRAMHHLAHELASALGISATYDAHYLAAAQISGAQFWTSDRRLAAAAESHLNWVRLLD